MGFRQVTFMPMALVIPVCRQAPAVTAGRRMPGRVTMMARPTAVTDALERPTAHRRTAFDFMTRSPFFWSFFRPLALTFLGLLHGGAWGASPPAADALDRVLAAGELRVCIWPEYIGISHRNPKTLELSGIDIDNAQEVARALGVRVRFVDSSFATLVSDLEADRCDIAMFAIGITEQRRQWLRFTEPYLASDIYAITTRENRRIRSWADIDLPGRVVVVAKGTLHEPVMRERLRAAELVVVNTPGAREQEVLAGRADVFMTDYPFGQRMLDQHRWARLVSPPEPYHITPYAWALRPQDERLRQRADQVLADMKRDGRLLAHARRHRLDPILSK